MSNTLFGEAFDIYKPFADAGNAAAQLNIGFLYATGKGAPKNVEMAITYWEAAAYQGEAEAQCCLGTMYWFGEDIPRNAEQAIYWLSRSAEQGNALAQQYLGSVYLEYEPMRNPTLARQWLLKSAAQGNGWELVTLAAAYAAEEPPDWPAVCAVLCFELAEAGEQTLKQAVQSIVDRMSNAERTEVKELVDQMKARGITPVLIQRAALIEAG